MYIYMHNTLHIVYIYTAIGPRYRWQATDGITLARYMHISCHGTGCTQWHTATTWK